MTEILAMLADFHFLRPWWLLALLPLALLALLLLRRTLRTGAWRQAVDPELVEWLVESDWRSTGRTALGVVLAAWLVAVLALAGPTFEQRSQPAGRPGDALVVILDLSLSMYAADISPSRMVRARLKVEDILGERSEGQTGLVAYAGDSHVVVPLTDDVRTIRNLLAPLEPRIMPVMGSRPERAIRQANQLFLDAGIHRGHILLISDGLRDPTTALMAVDDRFPISVLGIGTEGGAPIPLEPLGRDGHVRADGEVVIARLEEEGLRGLARGTGGRYARFTNDGSDLARLLTDPVASNGMLTDTTRDLERWVDAGPWLVLLLLPVALFAFRRGMLAAPLLGLLLLPPGADAFEWRDLFQRQDQQAYQALRSGQPEAASERFADPDWQATALYRSQRYEQAASAFPGEDARSHYNRGTALARAERFEEALEAFDAALELAPDFDDARHNREVVEDLLNQQRPDAANEQASQRDDPSWDDDDEGSAVSRRSDPADAEAGERDPQQGEEGSTRDGEQTEDPQAASGEPEQADQADQAAAERDAMAREREREQALEQWMRRVPDDPGALLQRKFRYEAERRRREGLLDRDERGRPW